MNIWLIILSICALLQGFLLVTVIVSGIAGLASKDYRIFKKLGRYWLYMLLVIFGVLILYGLVTIIFKKV